MTIEVNGSVGGSLQAIPCTSQQPATTNHGASPRVLIVGGGPAGLVTLRNFTADESSHNTSSTPLDAVLYERREDIGGVWFLDADTLGLEKRTGYASHQWPIESATHPRFPSPAYPALIGNLYPRFVSFSGQPFPPVQEVDVFPTLDETFKYLKTVAEPLRRRIKTKREVKDVWELPSPRRGKVSDVDGLPHSGGWLVHTLDHSTTPSTSLYEHFDAVTFAPSFTTHANWPQVPGLGAAIEQVPSKVHHAKWYRTPEPFWRAKRVVVIGNGLSTNDIAAQIAGRRKQEWGEELRGGEEPIRRAIRHEAVAMFPSLPDDRILESPPITRVEVRDDKSIHLTLADGEVIHDVDHLIVGTGYQVGIYDWLNVLRRPAESDDVRALEESGVTWNEGRDGWDLDTGKLQSHRGLYSLSSDLYVPLTPPSRHPTKEDPLSHDYLVRGSKEPVDEAYPQRVPHLHNHILNARNPSLSFSALIVSFAPFVLADLVSRWIRCVWQGDVRVPTNFGARREAEAERFSLLSQRRKDLEDKKKQPPAVSSGKAQLQSQPPSSLLAFHTLGTSEWPFQQSLHETLLKVKPWYADVVGLRVEEWTEERDAERMGMYDEKKRWLERREEERKRAIKTLEGVGE